MTNVATRGTVAVVLSMVTLVAHVGATDDPAAWTPSAWSNESTVKLGIVRTDGTPHWFKVWVVVLNGEPYVRLGTRSVAKIKENRSKPWVGLRVAGREFPRVELEPAPGDAEQVAQAMAEKYWSDVVVRLIWHPMTARLRPPPAAQHD